MEPRIDRLLDLREVVERTPDENFDMNNWLCGTTACAAGNYVLAFPDRGLRIEPYGIEQYVIRDLKNQQSFFSLADHFGLTLHDACWLFQPGSYNPIARWDGNIDGMRFGIWVPATLPTFRITRAQVIARIDAILKQYAEVVIEMKPTARRVPAGR